MIKNYSKSLLALVCAITIALGSCKKDSFVEPKAASGNLATLSASALESTSIPGSNSSSSFVLGVNGHPLGDLAYLGTPAAAQIDMIKKMGMGIYRINVLSTSDGTCTVPKVLQPLLDAAAAGNVTLLPMLTPRTLDYGDTEDAAYTKGKTIGANFAAKYAAVFNYYDLGNDLDVRSILSGKDGRITEDYDQKKLRVTAAYLTGMSEGIHANDPDAQTMISAGWLHWGFIKFCESYGLKYDILAYHWYSDMEAAIARSTSLKISDITIKLNTLFPGKPIWITETNFRASNLATLEADQNTFLTNFITKCKANPTVKAVLVYELFDEPYKNGGEQHYGIAKWATPYIKWINKLVGETFETLHTNASSDTVTNVPTVPVVVPVTEPSPAVALVSGLTGYSIAKPQTTALATGSTYYTDRTYQIKDIPSYLANALLIKTANDEKASKLNSYVSFNINRAATVYIAYDPRATTLPSWLQSFTKVGGQIGTGDPKLASMNIYKRDYAPGTVILGGNMSGFAAGALCQYFLMVQEN
ncbi:hypothetical protein FFF34_014745 [Inquilinus sp. KBS0705]|nr:hypothetical protein FFF34_014745 [Inquilinus sp. KBS0705]